MGRIREFGKPIITAEVWNYFHPSCQLLYLKAKPYIHFLVCIMNSVKKVLKSRNLYLYSLDVLRNYL